MGREAVRKKGEQLVWPIFALLLFDLRIASCCCVWADGGWKEEERRGCSKKDEVFDEKGDATANLNGQGAVRHAPFTSLSLVGGLGQFETNE